MDPNQNKNDQFDTGINNNESQSGSTPPNQNPGPTVFSPTDQSQQPTVTPLPQPQTNESNPFTATQQPTSSQPMPQTQPQPPQPLPQSQANIAQPTQQPWSPQTGQVPPVGGIASGVVGGSTGVNYENPKRKKQLLILAGAVIFVLLLLVGFVFGYYIPNKPENVFKKGITNTGKAIEYVADKYTADDQLAKLEKSEFKSDIYAKFQDGEYNGSLNGVFDSRRLTTDLKFESKSDSGKEDLTLKAKAELPEKSTYPNVFLQLDGSLVGWLDFFAPGASAYKGEWISIDSEYFQELAAQAAQTDTELNSNKNNENITREDVAELAKTLSGVSNEFIFSSDPQKAVLENRAFIGKEKEDDVSTYHYEVGVNKDNLKAYCKELYGRVFDLNIAKKIEPDDEAREKSKQSALESCDKDTEESLKDDPTFDMWIDKSNKVIYKARFSYKEDDKELTKAGAYKDSGDTTYTDFGQKYLGGDNLSFFIAGHSDKGKSDWRFNYEVNGKDITTKGDFNFKSEGDFAAEITGKFETKPFDGEIDVTPPEDAVDIREILKKFGVDPVSTNSKSIDTSYKVDINAIYAQVEVYYAENGFYPTLSQMNDPAFRSANMSNLEPSVFSPNEIDDVIPKLSNDASKDNYAYKTADCSNGGCQQYTLTAVLSDGTKFTKKNIN